MRQRARNDRLSLAAAGLFVGGAVSLCLGVGLAQVLSLFSLAVVAIAVTVVNLCGCIDPNLADPSARRRRVAIDCQSAAKALSRVVRLPCRNTRAHRCARFPATAIRDGTLNFGLVFARRCGKPDSAQENFYYWA